MGKRGRRDLKPEEIAEVERQRRAAGERELPGTTIIAFAQGFFCEPGSHPEMEDVQLLDQSFQIPGGRIVIRMPAPYAVLCAGEVAQTVKALREGDEEGRTDSGIILPGQANDPAAMAKAQAELRGEGEQA